MIRKLSYVGNASIENLPLSYSLEYNLVYRFQSPAEALMKGTIIGFLSSETDEKAIKWIEIGGISEQLIFFS